MVEQKNIPCNPESESHEKCRILAINFLYIVGIRYDIDVVKNTYLPRQNRVKAEVHKLFLACLLFLATLRA